jgi:hypothetical protein
MRYLCSLCCVATIACSSRLIADDLEELPASAQTCREMNQNSVSTRHGLVRTLALDISAATNRVVLVGVDSLNRARTFSAMINKKVDKTVKSQMVTVIFDATGQMVQATRTFRTIELPSGTGDSKSVLLPDADTARVRKLAAEVLRRCVH